MTVYSVVFVITLLCISTIVSDDVTNERRSHRVWNRLTGKIADRYNIDNRHLNDEAMLLFSDVAFQSLNDSKTWNVMVHGWRYQNNHRRDWFGFGASHWLQRLGRNLINPDDILYLNGSINHDRLRPFFVVDRKNENIEFNIGSITQTIETDRHGEFYEKIQVPSDVIQTLKRQNKGNIITYEAAGEDDKNLTGITHLIEPSQGISVISDIDDTIKISEVLDKVRLLANTFISPFKPVAGMPELYREWNEKNKDLTFHYLSGMPDQLYTLTQEFINTNRFPDGSFHMRHFGWAATSLFNFLHSTSTFIHKIRYLHFFLSNTVRDFVLIGDSGEKDPEIYGTVAREYPERIRAIFIRAIQGESFNDQRFIDAFEGVPREKWLIFNDPKQVPIDLSRAPKTIPK
ncbi:unnamed protein product [Adineta steineri]|uniref:Phosphatidate phosphatase APP1 catalytic domain-containing protein n=1 Tax=Adineta steineri TaxID=433720 RepID=A0A819TR46_9BILA|nr:unnamed protein product [Adineta steineri]